MDPVTRDETLCPRIVPVICPTRFNPADPFEVRLVMFSVCTSIGTLRAVDLAAITCRGVFTLDSTTRLSRPSTSGWKPLFLPFLRRDPNRSDGSKFIGSLLSGCQSGRSMSIEQARAIVTPRHDRTGWTDDERGLDVLAHLRSSRTNLARSVPT
jgi:hypothetical protein